MKNNYFINFDEPRLIGKDIKCVFCITNIERRRGSFLIVEENNQLVVYYSLVSSGEFVKLARNFNDGIKTLADVIELPEFVEQYNKQFLKKKVISDQQYVRDTIDRMYTNDIYNANNDVSGLDGWSVDLKLRKTDEKYYYAWCEANDSRYFYVLDFINYILDETEINSDYRFEKIEY